MGTTSGGNISILTVNAGSSSIKLALFAEQDTTRKVLGAAVENIGLPSAKLVTPDGTKPVTVANHSEATKLLTEWLAA